MSYIVIGICLILFAIILFIYIKIHFNLSLNKYNELKERENKLKESIKNTEDEIVKYNLILSRLNKDIGAKEQHWQSLTENSRTAFELYVKNLEESYNKKEIEYNEYTENLQRAYEEFQQNVIQEKQELDNLIHKRAAAQEILLNEEKLKANQDFYRLILTPAAKNDIEILKGIEDRLSIKRAIRKLIWETYIRPLCKDKFPQIIGGDKSACIYKITDLKTGKIYIGQHNANPQDRWVDHIKNAIIEEKHSKLYDAIGKDGIENFTFEVVEHCPIDKLNDREKFYVELFDSYDNGLNSTRGGA